MSNFAGMTKHFNLGSGRVLFAQKKGSVYKLKIFEIGSDNRYVDFSIVRWASFVRAIDEVQNAIYEIYKPTAKVSSSLRCRLLHLCLQTSNVLTSGKKTDYFILQKN